MSCYVLDANTTRAKAWLLANQDELVFSALHSLEVRNALKLGVFRGLFSLADSAAAWANLQSDLRGHRLVKRMVNWPLAFRLAAGLSDRHSATCGTRSLDILHVAVARTERASDFVSFDTRQRALAALAGFRVAP